MCAFLQVVCDGLVFARQRLVVDKTKDLPVYFGWVLVDIAKAVHGIQDDSVWAPETGAVKVGEYEDHNVDGHTLLGCRVDSYQHQVYWLDHLLPKSLFSVKVWQKEVCENYLSSLFAVSEQYGVRVGRVLEEPNIEVDKHFNIVHELKLWQRLLDEWVRVFGWLLVGIPKFLIVLFRRLLWFSIFHFSIRILLNFLIVSLIFQFIIYIILIFKIVRLILSVILMKLLNFLEPPSINSC